MVHSRFPPDRPGLKTKVRRNVSTWRSSITIGKCLSDLPISLESGVRAVALRPRPPQPAVVTSAIGVMDQLMTDKTGRRPLWLAPTPLMTSWLDGSSPDAPRTRWIIVPIGPDQPAPWALIAGVSSLRPRLAARSGDPEVLSRLCQSWESASVTLVPLDGGQIAHADDLFAGLLAWQYLNDNPNPWEDPTVQAVSRLMPSPPRREGLTITVDPSLPEAEALKLRWQRSLGAEIGRTQ